eukprot:TRINITY_DN7009_c0_g1_i2.p1 TRINITY_DN7009_c0_g1~~TRINITY_DN7009_c0_g1_i2.p1  ORF type:complete len:693 (+),score=178.19 TRINITY_DN7009_c0_g1_i2:39-2117(+)
MAASLPMKGPHMDASAAADAPPSYASSIGPPSRPVSMMQHPDFGQMQQPQPPIWHQNYPMPQQQSPGPAHAQQQPSWQQRQSLSMSQQSMPEQIYPSQVVQPQQPPYGAPVPASMVPMEAAVVASTPVKDIYSVEGLPNIKLLPKTSWVPDRQAKVCMRCPFKFSFRNRRHHCRICGYVVCQGCSRQRHPLLADHRICRICYSVAMAEACGLQQHEWYHGSTSRATAISRLSTPVSEVGDFLLRESASKDGFLAISAKEPHGLAHRLVYGSAGDWYIVPRQRFVTIQELVDEYTRQGRFKRAAAIITRDGQADGYTSTNCHNCKAPLDDAFLEESPFCNTCGTRVRSSEAHLELYSAQVPNTDKQDGKEQEQAGVAVSEETNTADYNQNGQALYAPPPALAQEPEDKESEVNIHPDWESDPRTQLLKDVIVTASQLNMFSQLGGGRLGVVRDASYQGISVAVKLGRNKEADDGVLHEAICLMTLTHPRIVKLVGVTLSSPTPGLVLHKCSGPNLETHLKLKTSKKQLTIKHRIQYCKEICEGLAYLASRQVAHGDLAARNILLNGAAGLQLADFDLARWPGSVQQDCSHVVSTRWAAPELILSRNSPSCAADIWSFGVTCWEVFSHAAKPHDLATAMQIKALHQQRKGMVTKPKLCPLACWQLVEQCFNYDPTARTPAATQLSGYDALLECY